MRIFIKLPVITEKTIAKAETENKYTFEVTLDADKTVAKKQIEKLYGVNVTGVTSHTRLGKKVRFGRSRRQSTRGDKKFMIFTLKTGQEIDIFKQA